MRFLMLLLLFFSGASIWLTLSKTPAFNPRLIADTVIGDGRIIENAAMYDPGTYAFQRGYGFLISDALVSSDTVERDEVASAELAADRARLADEAFELAVSLDPGNAYAWATLAWARARLGNNSSAMVALRVSWEIAPNNSVLADTRLNLAGLLTNPEIGFIEPTEVDRAAMAQDMEVLRLFNPRTLAAYMESSPHLVELPADAVTK
jgi:hypothetical protein